MRDSFLPTAREIVRNDFAASLLLVTAKAYLRAVDDFRVWHDSNPGASGSRFSDEAEKVDCARLALEDAITTAERGR